MPSLLVEYLILNRITSYKSTLAGMINFYIVIYSLTVYKLSEIVLIIYYIKIVCLFV